MSKTSNSNWETTVKPIVVLSVISLVVSLLLALVNSMTAPVIAENTKRTTLAAYVGVLPSVSDATELEEVTGYTTANVTGVVKAPDGSLAIKAEESGFDGGIVTVIVGMDANGTETGIWVDASTQTKGIGSAVAEDDFLNISLIITDLAKILVPVNDISWLFHRVPEAVDAGALISDIIHFQRIVGAVRTDSVVSSNAAENVSHIAAHGVYFFTLPGSHAATFQKDCRNVTGTCRVIVGAACAYI